jgi:hypothetical protein
MTTGRRRSSDEIQTAVDRWMADYVRASRLRIAGDATTYAAELQEAEALGPLAKRGDRKGCGPLEAHINQQVPQRSIRRRGTSARSLALIDASIRILEEIQPASIRAVCYRLFTMGLITSMAKSENRVSTQLTWARETGAISWAWIVDETRAPERVNAWENPAAFIETVQRSYRRDRWTDQPEWVEVWSEKGTIRGTLAPILNTYGVTFRVMHGYGSATAVHQAAQESHHGEKLLTVFYVGDHDPSGLHMSKADLPQRLKDYGGVVDLIRLALTEEDTRSGLPWFATETKRQDPRFSWYWRRHGSRCWELDALSPVVLRERVEQAIVERLDLAAWKRAEVVEHAERDSLTSILNAWPDISGQASEYGDPQR